MSDFLGEVADVAGLGDELAAARDFLGLSGLKPGSFRGVRFDVDDTDLGSGRRVVTHEFPLRDDTFTEDMGRKKRELSIGAYVIGADWKERRDELLYACEDFEKPGTLVLPGGLEFIARCETVRVTESGGERRLARFALTFTEAGEIDAPLRAKLDTATLLRRAVGRVLRVMRAGFSLYYATRNLGDLVGGSASAALVTLAEGLAGRWLGLPGLDLSAVARAISGVSTADVAAPMEAVLLPSRKLVDAGLLMPRGQAAPALADATTSRAAPVPSRIDTGFALLAEAVKPIETPPVTPGVIGARVEANRLALDGLSRDAAALMAAEMFSATDFGSLAEARRARNALLDAIDQRADAAADAGRDDLFRGWREVAAAAARDMTERARRAPILAAYSLPESMPSLALSQRLYRTGARADDLVGLNDAPHPAFMPRAGQVLR